jgi:hypothetical protein
MSPAVMSDRPFYAWTWVIVDGQVVAADYAPDVEVVGARSSCRQFA